jgi:myosin heavy subunit
MQKILIILAAVLSLGATTLGYLNRGKLLESRAESAKFQSESSSNAKKAATTASELKAANEKLVIAGTEAERTASELLEARSQASKATSTLTDVQKQVADKDAALALQKTDMEAKDTRIAELETKTSKSAQSSDSGALAELKKKIDEKDVINAGLESKVKDIQSQLSKYKENESRRHANAMKSGLEGRILAVNSAWNFVVLSLGDRNGVINNAEMIIKRGPQRIGKIRITSVEPSTSIADIIANSVRSGLTVQPGDTVIYYGPEDGSDPLKQ